MRPSSLNQFPKNQYKQLGSNNIQSRITQLTQLLSKNNAMFPKALPSEQQFKNIIDHSFNCYDQLDFIFLEYTKQPVNYLDPRIMAEYMQKILRITKYLFSNIRYWMDSYSLQLVKLANDAKYSQDHQMCLTSVCNLCQRHIEEMAVKEAKEQITGPSHWRQLFEEELREEREAKRKGQQQEYRSPETKEYISSVNFLTKIIREMEESAKGYQRLAEKVQGETEYEDATIRVLDELINKMKSQFGARYKLKLKNMVRKWEEKAGESGRKGYGVTEQFNMVVEGGVRQRISIMSFGSEDKLVSKLKNENKRLSLENLAINDQLRYMRQNYINNLEGSPLKRAQSMVDDFRKYFSDNDKTGESERMQEERGVGNTHHKGTIEGAVQNTEYNKLSLVNSRNGRSQHKNRKGMSIFNVKHFETRKSELSNIYDKTMEDGNNQGQKQNGQCGKFKLEQLKKDVGCQWENIKQAVNSKRGVSLRKNQNKRTTISKVQYQGDLNFSTSEKDKRNKLHQNQIISKKSLPQQSFASKGRINDAISSTQLKGLERLKQNFNVEMHILQNPRQSMDSADKTALYNTKSGKNILSSKNHIDNNLRKTRNVQKPKKVKTSHQKNRLVGDGIVNKARNTYAVLKSVRNSTQQGKGVNQTAVQIVHKDKNFHIKTRNMTQGCDTFANKRDKIIRNIIFKPEHLTIFGGVSESYAYQNWKAELSEQKLQPSERQIYKGLKLYIQNLKGFKSAMYENIVVFLKEPFQTIEKNQIGFKHIISEDLQKIVLKLLLFHKKKCGALPCSHLQTFADVIGFKMV